MSALMWLAVALLGGCGALARFALDWRIARGCALPLGTLAINLSGSLLLGLLLGASLSGDALLLAGTAALGSYTTFSTWMLETYRSAEDGELALAAASLTISMLGGLGAAALGRVFGAAL
ncbi:MAG TPA: fluoride efflux transporter CrcB [Solirubrobacteraceae bacterium]|nr:fluoride efflux transporter CrcB [Solirubrobacteraceae bacterium]